MHYQLPLALFALSGFMNGCFMLPMSHLKQWKWEQIWLPFIIFACIVMPIIICSNIITKTYDILPYIPEYYILFGIITGIMWGFGTIFFSLSVNYLGVSLGNTLVLSFSSGFGTIFPLLSGTNEVPMPIEGIKNICFGLFIEVIGICLCGIAGFQREHKNTSVNHKNSSLKMLSAILMAIASGLMSGIFNIGFSQCKPIITYANYHDFNIFEATNIVWLLILIPGSLPSIFFCSYLIFKKKSRLLNINCQKSYSRVILYTFSMALLWSGSVFVYGAGAALMTHYGPAIGWASSLGIALLTANAGGIINGEWQGTASTTRYILFGGVLCVFVSIAFIALAAA